MSTIDLTKLSPGMFSKAVLKMEDVYLGNGEWNVTADQVKATLASIVWTDHLKLKKFHVSVFFDEDDDDIDLTLVSKALERVKLNIDEYVYENESID